jgi:uncharacterized tellurite resistance protein B-like protein
VPAASLNLLLGRVLIAAAWSDGQLADPERSGLRDLMFRLPDLTVGDWKTLDAEVDVPVDATERTRRVRALQAAATTPDERRHVQAAIETLLAEGSGLGAEDRAVLEEVLASLETPSLLSRLGGLFQEPLRRRAQALTAFFQKEREFQDDVRRRIHRSVRARMSEHGHLTELSEEEFHRLCLAGAILARVAHVDEVVTKGEYSVIADALQQGWDLSVAGAALVTEIAISEVAHGLDDYALVREFFQCTTEKERIRFLGVLFRVAEADGHVSHEETEEIRLISKGLLLSHRHFIAAKTRVPQQRRDE